MTPPSEQTNAQRQLRAEADRERWKNRHEKLHKQEAARLKSQQRDFDGFLKATKTWEFADWVHDHHDEDDWGTYALFAFAQVLRKMLPNMTLWEFKKLATQEVGWDKEKSWMLRGGLSDYATGQFSLAKEDLR